MANGGQLMICRLEYFSYSKTAFRLCQLYEIVRSLHDKILLTYLITSAYQIICYVSIFYVTQFTEIKESH